MIDAIRSARASIRAPERAGYRPHLDGLRALAVYLVVAFHAGVGRVSGGFIGVDVFFVLSGYLVTGVLLRAAAERQSGRLRRFYVRRVRRLLPAAAVNLVVSALVFRAIATPAELPAARDASRAAAFWFSNWWFIRESADYFATNLGGGPVAHYWSLSVEEQFYVVWPLAVAAVLWTARRLGRDGRRAVAVVVVVAGSASFWRALSLATTDLNRAYYGTDTRAYQLLAGAGLALLPSLVAVRRRPAVARALDLVVVGSIMGLVVLSTSWVTVNAVSRGAVAAMLTIAAVLSLEAGAGGLFRRALSTPAVTFLGRVSYGTYLWHWIVVLVATRELELGPAPTLALTAVVGTALATLSFVFLERPIRTASGLDGIPRLVVAGGLALSVVVGAGALPLILRTSADPRELRAGSNQTVRVDWQTALKDRPDFNGCETGGAVLCRITEGSGPRVLVVGDSHAGMLLPAFKAVAEEHDLELASVVTYYCPWTSGMRFTLFTLDCLHQQDVLYDKTLPAFDPDLVILVHLAIDDPNDPIDVFDAEAGLLKPGPAREPLVARRVRQTIEALRADGRKVAIIEPLPIDGPHPSGAACLSKATSLDQCAFRASPGPLPEERVFRAEAQADAGVWSVDLDRLACPNLPRCDPVVNGQVVRYDNSHLTGAFVRTIADDLGRRLVKLRIIDP